MTVPANYGTEYSCNHSVTTTVPLGTFIFANHGVKNPMEHLFWQI